MAAAGLSSPALTRIPREARKSLRHHPPLCSGPAGASSIACGPSIAIETAMVAGSSKPGSNDMAVIGTFKQIGDGEFLGDIFTFSLRATGVRLVPEASRSSDKAPSHRVLIDRVEIGACWSKRSNEGRDYLSLKLDDPSCKEPIYANLFNDEGGETFSLIWSRGRKQNGD
jgi:uncharacterized protein (DUF736 family)